MVSPTLPRLIFQDGPLQGEEIELSQEQTVIGRDPGVDLRIASPVVSRRHARIFRQNRRFLVEDLGSSNHTYLNGQRLEGPLPLKSGDSLQLGGAVRIVYLAPMDDSTPSASVDQTRLDAAPPNQAQTVLDIDLTPPGSAISPVLVVAVAGGNTQTYKLVKERLSLGRSADNDIVIPSPIVSGHHALLERTSAGWQIAVLPNATNPISQQGNPLNERHTLRTGDVLRIGSLDPGSMVTLTFLYPGETSAHQEARQIPFAGQDRVQIGRDPSNDVMLEAPTVSRFHALVERVGQRYRVRDLSSSNGTFVNDRRIERESWVKAGDAIRIGPYRFVLGADQLVEYDETGGLRVEAIHLNKWVRKDLNLLKDISLVFNPREFVVVVGQSGGGKSTLVDAIAGYRLASDGMVRVNDINVYQDFAAIRDKIGFVPQKDIIHMELSVYQELDYAARLRLPPDTSPQERHQRVMEVLQDLDLVHRKDLQISGLSGGQQKRVSIGVELLTKPGLFFLDEPTSGLDPGTETALMHLMRRLADQGRTIILITHATKNVMLADKVVFLARGGYLAWFGPPEEALKFFDQYRAERDRRARPMEFDEIYAILDDPEKGKAEDWARRFREHSAFHEYIVRPLEQRGYGATGLSTPSTSPGYTLPRAASAPGSATRAGRSRTSTLRQFRILSARNLKILSRDRASLILMLAVAPLVGLLDVVLAVALGRDLFDYQNGNMAKVITSMFMPLMYAILVGSISQMREFVKEKEIFRRERLVNLRVFPYVLSKVWVAGMFALYQAACFTVIHYLSFKMPGGAPEFFLFYLTMFLVVFSGMMLGLLGSSLAPNANAAPLLVILLIVPQLVMAGALIPLPGAVTGFTTTRWAFEVLVGISGVGSDVAADSCWELPEELRDEMDLEMKSSANCRCMGINALRRESCEFPGIGKFYDPSIDQPEPVEPEPIGDPPLEPDLPPAPDQPSDQTDQVAMANFFQQMQDYQDEVEQIQEQYKRQIEDYQALADVYQAEAIAYQEDLARWEIDRNAAVGKAEGLIDSFNEDFRWAFVDKSDADVYWPKLSTAWGMQLVFQSVCLGLIMFLMVRKR